MTVSIKNPEAHRLARRLAALSGETIATAITIAVRERLERVQGKELQERILLLEDIRAISEHCA